MGEAKRRRELSVPTVYHHTSTLRTNLIWMSGVIDVEGRSKGVIHPQLGEIHTNVFARRELKDFPALAWFTTKIEVPKILIEAKIVVTNRDSVRADEIELTEEMSNAIALQRVALGFPINQIPVVPWCEHIGYGTNEGQDLNESARAAGDEPDDWYVSEEAVDVLKISEFWASQSVRSPKLRRIPSYIKDIRRMVELCRSQEGVYIPPSWMKHDEAQELASRINASVVDSM